MVLIEPWAVAPLFGFAPADTVDRVIDLARSKPRLAELLRAAARAGDPLEAVSHELAGLVRTAEEEAELTEALAILRQEAGAVPIAEVAARAGLSERRLRRLFLNRVGVAPKSWSMIERFAANLRRLHPKPWGECAAEPDYFDQAHEIREFRALGGITPGAYRREKLAGDRRVFAWG